MKVLVIYHSRSGNTKKLAEAITEGCKVSDIEVELKSVENVSNEDLVAADGLIVGSPVYFGTMSAELKAMFDKSIKVRGKLIDKVGAAFTTAGHPTGGKETTILSIIEAMLIHQMIVVGDPLSVGGHYGSASTGSPSDNDLESATALGKRVSEVVMKMGK